MVIIGHVLSARMRKMQLRRFFPARFPTAFVLAGVCFSGEAAVFADHTIPFSAATVETVPEFCRSHYLPVAAHSGSEIGCTEGCGEVASAPTFCESLLTQPKLTGDWFGCRSDLAESGYTFDVSNTQYYQGVTTGGLQQQFQFGGRNDYYLNIDGAKAGLWKGSLISLRGETRYGESVNNIAGTLMPPNLLLAIPQPDGTVTALTGVKFTQFLSEDNLVYAGKIMTFDGYIQPLTGATGLSGFLNTAMIVNPVLARTGPYSTYGAGYAHLQNGEPLFSIAAFDTNNTPTTSGFDTFFDNGVVTTASVNLPTTFLGLPGHQGITGLYGSGTYTDLNPSIYLDPVLGPQLLFTERSGSWCLMYNADQAFYVDPSNPQHKWGVFTNLGIADKNPSPIRWSAVCGISGSNPSQSRPNDTFGLGYFYVAPTDAAKALINPKIPVGDEQGVELYYNIAVSPWCQITPDLQIISPVRENIDTTILFGLRAKIDF